MTTGSSAMRLSVPLLPVGLPHDEYDECLADSLGERNQHQDEATPRG